MRTRHFIFIGVLLCGLLTGIARAETFQLTDGEAVTGEIVSFTEAGLVVRLPDDTYSERIPWAKFSQADLRKLVQNPKITEFVEPFIEVSQEERMQRNAIKINPVPRLTQPEPQSLFGALFSSGVGIFLLLAIYAANIYAGFEVAVFRGQAKALVCGVSAVLPILGPIIFLSIPTKIENPDDQVLTEAQAAAAAGPGYSVPPSPEAQAAAAAEAASALHLAHSETGQGGGPLPPTQTFQRGAFTFNRRFLETKFSGFFGVVRRDAEKNMVLVIKAARGTHIATRITRIASNDMHVEVHRGHASEEVMIPFSEIQEIQLKHKDA